MIEAVPQCAPLCDRGFFLFQLLLEISGALGLLLFGFLRDSSHR
jgi:hypothetical protein